MPQALTSPLSALELSPTQIQGLHGSQRKRGGSLLFLAYEPLNTFIEIRALQLRDCLVTCSLRVALCKFSLT